MVHAELKDVEEEESRRGGFPAGAVELKQQEGCSRGCCADDEGQVVAHQQAVSCVKARCLQAWQIKHTATSLGTHPSNAALPAPTRD